MRQSVLLIGAVMVMAVAGPVEAQRFVAGSHSSTAVSGYSGRTERIGADENGLYEIKVTEEMDEPCMVRIDFRALHEKGVTWGGNINSVYSHCTDERPPQWSPGLGGHVEVSFEGNTRYFIRGLQVCTNDKDNRRLKGLKVWAAKVSKEDQRVLDLGETRSDSLNNCRIWHSAVFCPAGQVAFGLVVHVGDKGITGLALRCKEVAW